MKLTAKRNQCQSCKQYFNSTSAFDFHRHGKFGLDRRCMTSLEMTKFGMLVNSDGFWITEKFNGFINKDKPHSSDAAAAHNQPKV